MKSSETVQVGFCEVWALIPDFVSWACFGIGSHIFYWWHIAVVIPQSRFISFPDCAVAAED